VIFERFVREGSYEPEVMSAIAALATANTYVFDVGANVGLISASLLARSETPHVVSFECSPSVLPFLKKTIACSKYSDRWALVEKAIGSTSGRTKFYTTGSANSAYDALTNTGRGGVGMHVDVEVTTLDQAWMELDQPAVSVIKLDIEGGETEALRGAKALISSCKPHILFEWHAENLSANGISEDSIFSLIPSGYELMDLRSLIAVSRNNLRILMSRSEMFWLSPTQP